MYVLSIHAYIHIHHTDLTLTTHLNNTSHNWRSMDLHIALEVVPVDTFLRFAEGYQSRLGLCLSVPKTIRSNSDKVVIIQIMAPTKMTPRRPRAAAVCSRIVSWLLVTPRRRPERTCCVWSVNLRVVVVYAIPCI